jgi:integrase
MAFVFKNRNTKYWLAGFRDSTGKRRNRSTKLLAVEKTKRQAERIAVEYEAAANRSRTALQVRRTIVDLHKELTGRDIPSVSISSQVQLWLKSKKSSVSFNTTAFYEGATEKFIGYLGSRADDDLDTITREDLEDFRDTLAKKLASKTVNQHVKVVRMVFRDARNRSLLLDDPTEFVETVKAKKVLDRRPFSIAEMKSILAHCDDEWRSMVYFGFYSGQRLGDIAKMKWSSIDLQKGSLRITTSKTDKFLNVPLHPDLWNHLKSLPAPIDPSLPIHPEAAAIIEEQKRTALLSNRFGRILAAAGLREKRPHRALGEGRDGKRELNSLSFHSFRRSATTLLHEAGVHQSVAMVLIGHDSADIHAVYVNIGEQALREASAKLPSIAG